MKWIENGTLVRVTTTGTITPCQPGEIGVVGVTSPSSAHRPFVKNCAWVMTSTTDGGTYTLFVIDGANVEEAYARAMRVLSARGEPPT